MRYEMEILEKIMYYDQSRIISSFPLYVYRTKKKVNRPALEAAVFCAIRCHPLFGCRIMEDETGPYLETNPEKPVIPDVSPTEVYCFGGESSHHYPWIVGIHGSEIIYTGFHGLVDGMGATAFMRTVLYYYFKEQGFTVSPGEAVTLEELTPESLRKDTACAVRENGGEDHPSMMKPGNLAPTVFPDELLAEDPEGCAVYNLAISLKDIREKCAEYEVSQFAVMTTYIAQAICSVLPGEENVVLMNVVADMRGVLGSVTTHNCVMTVPVTYSQKELKNKSDALICTMFRSRLDLGFNRDEALHSCFNSAQMEQRIGSSKAYLAGAAAQIEQRFGFDRPTATVAYTHLTHTGYSDSLFKLLDDVYISYAGYPMQGKKPIRAIAAVTTDRVINLMLMDETKDEQILKALEKRLTEAGVSYKTRKLERYKGILYQG